MRPPRTPAVFSLLVILGCSVVPVSPGYAVAAMFHGSPTADRNSGSTNAEPFAVVEYDSCVVVCPLGDAVFRARVSDSLGHPIRQPGTVWLDFSRCAAAPCGSDDTLWPVVRPDSVDGQTGVFSFSVRAGAFDAYGYLASLHIGQSLRLELPVVFLDRTGDLCVGSADALNDSALAATHRGHCGNGGCLPGPAECGRMENDTLAPVEHPELLTADADPVAWYRIKAADDCGDPVCDPEGTWLDFGASPVPADGRSYPEWPLVHADSCDPATGWHYFAITDAARAASGYRARLFLNAAFCRVVVFKPRDARRLTAIPDDK